MNGDVTAAEQIELTPTANVTGTLTAPSVVMQEGATFNGMVDMDRSKSKQRAKTTLTVVEPIARAS
jgi:cytoskeletal protein CcmA (bactofilin family)